MNTETQELIQQYIIETVKDSKGISSPAYEILKYLMKVDRNFASSLHEVFEQCVEYNDRYRVQENDFMDDTE